MHNRRREGIVIALGLFRDSVGASHDPYSTFVETCLAESPARVKVPIPEVPHNGYLVLNQTKLNQVSEKFQSFLPWEYALLLTSAFILLEENRSIILIYTS